MSEDISPELEESINSVISQVPDADREQVMSEFLRYQEEFLIPPQDALRNVLRKFGADKQGTPGEIRSATPRPSKRVASFNELKGDDKDVTIDVKVITYNVREQKVRGEDMKVGWGRLEDQPALDSSQRVIWEYKDWGGQVDKLIPGSTVRLEGVSVNEYQGKMSINVNRSTRITILEKSTQPILDLSEPTDIAKASEIEGQVTVVGRILGLETRTFTRKDGSGEQELVKGRLGDRTGVLNFASWVPFNHEKGDLVKIERGNVRVFRNVPELNISNSSVIEEFRDAGFPTLVDLENHLVLDIAHLKDGLSDVVLTAQLVSLTERVINVQGERKTIWGGELLDPSGRCRLTSWGDPNLAGVTLPAMLEIRGAKVRTWQGMPEVVIDGGDCVKSLSESPWGEMNPDDHWIKVELHELVAGGRARSGVEVDGMVIQIRPDSGIIFRCTECNRALRDDTCAVHGDVRGAKDMRCRIILDNGKAGFSGLLNKDASEKWLGKTLEEVDDLIRAQGRDAFIASLSNQYIGRHLRLRGHWHSDTKGDFFRVESASTVPDGDLMDAESVRTKWGVD